jgi:hypothetical protein
LTASLAVKKADARDLIRIRLVVSTFTGGIV